MHASAASVIAYPCVFRHGQPGKCLSLLCIATWAYSPHFKWFAPLASRFQSKDTCWAPALIIWWPSSEQSSHRKVKQKMHAQGVDPCCFYDTQAYVNSVRLCRTRRLRSWCAK
jgi:hypothetical protein